MRVLPWLPGYSWAILFCHDEDVRWGKPLSPLILREGVKTVKMRVSCLKSDVDCGLVLSAWWCTIGSVTKALNLHPKL